MRFLRFIAAASLVAACGGDTTTIRTGLTRVLLTDAPFPYDRIARVDVHVVRVQVAATPDSSSPNQSWTTIAEPNRTINLLELQSGTTTLLGETEVSATTVGAVRLVMNTTLSSVTDNAGRAVQVHWPLAGELALHAYVQASLANFAEGTPHNLVIDFDVGRSFADVHGNGSLTFIPWIRVIDDAGAGSVSGTVRGATTAGGATQTMANVAVTVLHGDPNANPLTWYKIATGRTDAQGRYTVAYILHGTYIVRAEPLGNTAAGCMDVKNVIVTNGASTTVDMDLPASPGTCARFTGVGGGQDTSGTGSNGGGASGGAVAAVAVTVWPQTLAVGDSAGAYANLTNAQGASLYGRAVDWQVSNTSVLGITGAFGQSLILRAKASGTVTITATSEGVSASRTVTVQ